MSKKEIGVWIFFAICLLAIPVAFWKNGATKFKDENYPTYATLPDFALVNQDNQPVTKQDLLGNVWVANFIFTSCANSCPLLTKKMAELQSFIEAEHLQDIKLVSISVDPATDRPEKLKAYAERFHVNTKFWNFLTGDNAAIEKIVVSGFHVAKGDREPNKDFFDIVHGNRFVLVDTLGQIRGYYSVDDAEGASEKNMAALKKDISQFQQGIGLAKNIRVH